MIMHFFFLIHNLFIGHFCYYHQLDFFQRALVVMICCQKFIDSTNDFILLRIFTVITTITI